MEFTIDYLSDITYKCELTLDIKDVKGLIRANNLRRTLCSVSYALIKGEIQWLISMTLES